MSVTLAEIQLVNSHRALRWHGSAGDWSGLEWAGAMCGEAGEAANLAKKLKRIEQGLSGNQASEHKFVSREEMVEKLAEEIADTILYGMLLASHYRINVERAVIEKFNKKSIEQGFPERLGAV